MGCIQARMCGAWRGELSSALLCPVFLCHGVDTSLGQVGCAGMQCYPQSKSSIHVCPAEAGARTWAPRATVRRRSRVKVKPWVTGIFKGWANIWMYRHTYTAFLASSFVFCLLVRWGLRTRLCPSSYRPGWSPSFQLLLPLVIHLFFLSCWSHII